MKKKSIAIGSGIFLIAYIVFLTTMAISGINDVDREVRYILAGLVCSGKLRLDEKSGIIVPVSDASRDEFGSSLALYMKNTIKLKQESQKGITPYLSGDNIYYHFKCQRQEKVVIPFLVAILMDKSKQHEISNDIVQKVLDSFDIPAESEEE